MPKEREISTKDLLLLGTGVYLGSLFLYNYQAAQKPVPPPTYGGVYGIYASARDWFYGGVRPTNKDV